MIIDITVADHYFKGRTVAAVINHCSTEFDSCKIQKIFLIPNFLKYEKRALRKTIFRGFLRFFIFGGKKLYFRLEISLHTLIKLLEIK